MNSWTARLWIFLLLFLVKNTLLIHAEFYSLVERYRRQQTDAALTETFLKSHLQNFMQIVVNKVANNVKPKKKAWARKMRERSIQMLVYCLSTKHNYLPCTKWETIGSFHLFPVNDLETEILLHFENSLLVIFFFFPESKLFLNCE